MSNDQEKHIEFLEKENKDLQTKLTTAEKALAKKIPPELRGASLTIIGHPMMIEQVRQNYVLKDALKIYADEDNWFGVGGGTFIDTFKYNKKGYEPAQEALDKLRENDV